MTRSAEETRRRFCRKTTLMIGVWRLFFPSADLSDGAPRDAAQERNMGIKAMFSRNKQSRRRDPAPRRRS